METVIITSIYNEIIDYYHYFEPETIGNEEDDIIAFRMSAYRDFESDDKWETEVETLKNYLSKHFRFLMKNVFCLDIKNYKAQGSKGSYFVYKKDSLIFKEILLRSVSQNKHDLVIGRWLEGKIEDDDYHALVELSHRLFVIIDNTDAESEVKEQWSESLRIALRTDFAYTMTEVEFTVKEIFSKSLPFKVNGTDSTKNIGSGYSSISHSDFKDSIVAELDTNDMTAQDSIFNIVYEYLKTADFEKMKETESFPPVELLKMKRVCEVLLPLEGLHKSFPNPEIIGECIDYFTSIDKEFQNKIQQRKENDKKRHQRNNVAKKPG